MGSLLFAGLGTAFLAPRVRVHEVAKKFRAVQQWRALAFHPQQEVPAVAIDEGYVPEVDLHADLLFGQAGAASPELVNPRAGKPALKFQDGCLVRLNWSDSQHS
jgi:hypothetical protein